MFSNHHLAPAGMPVLTRAANRYRVCWKCAFCVLSEFGGPEITHYSQPRVPFGSRRRARIFSPIQINTQKHIARVVMFSWPPLILFICNGWNTFQFHFLIWAMDSELIIRTFHLRARYFHLLHKRITETVFSMMLHKDKQNVKKSECCDQNCL